MAEETGIEFFRRRLAEVEQLSTNLDQRADLIAKRTEVGVWFCAWAIGQLADELRSFQVTFNNLWTANELGRSDKTTNDLPSQRARLTKLQNLADSVAKLREPHHEGSPS
jgi:hypothetical protein